MKTKIISDKFSIHEWLRRENIAEEIYRNSILDCIAFENKTAYRFMSGDRRSLFEIFGTKGEK